MLQLVRAYAHAASVCPVEMDEATRGTEGSGTSEAGAARREGEREKTGRAKRRERRMQHEPQSVTGEASCSGIHALDFAEARATELSNMVKALESKGGSKRTFQHLPRHMRRRAMSHNVKRLPRRLREAAGKEMAKSASGCPADKRSQPSRKQRRKGRSLREEYARRQRSHMWLETHVWHAKRFKMSKLHGYHLAEHASDKGVRPAYRSLVHGCLLSDVSYLCCVEVGASCQADIIGCLGPLFSSDTGLTLAAKAYTSGRREGRAVVYRAGAYPFGAIGPVHFLWRANVLDCDQPPHKDGIEKGSPCPAQLWVFCHPAMFDELFGQVSELAAESTQQGDTPGLSERGGGRAITVRSLKDELIRFRLIGPRSHALLMETLKPILKYNQPPETETKIVSEQDKPSTVDKSQAFTVERWWEGLSGFEAHLRVVSSHYKAVKEATCPAQFGRGTVIGMTVRDPRLFTPSKKTDMVSAFYPKGGSSPHDFKEDSAYGRSYDSDDSFDSDEFSGSEAEMLPPFESSSQTAPVVEPPMPTDLPVELSYSPVWDDAVRDKATLSKAPESLLDALRSEQLIKSPELRPGTDKVARIPVLAIQHSPQAHASSVPPPRQILATSRESIYRASGSDVGTGWDLVLPKGWAMPFWIALIYRGARACGLGELRKCSLECLSPHFPQDFPDTPAGEESSRLTRRSLEEQFRRCPPDKRKSFAKLCISSPFHCPWEETVRHWQGTCGGTPDHASATPPSTGGPFAPPHFGSPAAVQSTPPPLGDPQVATPPSEATQLATPPNADSRAVQLSLPPSSATQPAPPTLSDAALVVPVMPPPSATQPAPPTFGVTPPPSVMQPAPPTFGVTPPLCDRVSLALPPVESSTLPSQSSSTGESTDPPANPSCLTGDFTDLSSAHLSPSTAGTSVCISTAALPSSATTPQLGKSTPPSGQTIPPLCGTPPLPLKRLRAEDDETTDTVSESRCLGTGLALHSSVPKELAGDCLTSVAKRQRLAGAGPQHETTPTALSGGQVTECCDGEAEMGEEVNGGEEMGVEIGGEGDVSALMEPRVSDSSSVSLERTSFYVLRSREVLKSVSLFARTVLTNNMKLEPNVTELPLERMDTLESASKEFGISECISEHSSSLISVRFEMLRGGSITGHGTISLPSVDDLASLINDKHFSGPSERINPKGMTVVEGESIVFGLCQLPRRQMKEVRQARARRERERKKNQKKMLAKTAAESLNGESSLVKERESVSLPAQDFELTPVLASRSAIGYAVSGSAGYRLSSSVSGGVALCSLAGLVQLVHRCFCVAGTTELIALFRSESIQHRLIRLSIVV